MEDRVLVTGASVAGVTAAWWLARQGIAVDLVERAASFRTGGQNVDVRGAGRAVLRRMALEQAALDLSTGEYGTDLVDSDNQLVARFGVDGDGDRGPTAELEIRRGDIARLILDDLGDGVATRFGDHVAGIVQDDTGVDVTFASGRTGRYATVIVAEGVGSSTRELVFPGENDPRSMDMTVAYFSVPRRDHDGDYARLYNTTEGRSAILKPDREATTLGAYIGMQGKADGTEHWDIDRQKRHVRERFADVGWELPRLLDAMEATDDFYYDVMRQVRMERWSNGRVFLTGDAAWCPTGMSGIGTTLAIVGSYVLVGELRRHADPRAAALGYDTVMRPYVDEGQGLPRIVPRLLWPHSRIGVGALRTAARVVSAAPLQKLVAGNFARDAEKVDLPEYSLGTARVR
ncbi:FAD-binding monooxygenase [Sphingomonas sp. Leaf23]|uniref:FAD-dependent monooxygenase n=1 Tax=Sphingomonas sp. Leaf23 TaxID=1735689 RepID=UPI0006FC2B56|nr:FAD-dependent monooxygenase [Sphingomonas sp. Leaf23]KQM88771.1 FAD-binding monooxygenase [Sphingomonas sp. Leaf23]